MIPRPLRRKQVTGPSVVPPRPKRIAHNTAEFTGDQDSHGKNLNALPDRPVATPCPRRRRTGESMEISDVGRMVSQTEGDYDSVFFPVQKKLWARCSPPACVCVSPRFTGLQSVSGANSWGQKIVVDRVRNSRSMRTRNEKPPNPNLTTNPRWWRSSWTAPARWLLARTKPSKDLTATSRN